MPATGFALGYRSTFDLDNVKVTAIQQLLAVQYVLELSVRREAY